MRSRGNKKKERWDKPEVTILTRGRPDEKVLWGCKTDSEFVASEGYPSQSLTCEYYPCLDYPIDTNGPS